MDKTLELITNLQKARQVVNEEFDDEEYYVVKFKDGTTDDNFSMGDYKLFYGKDSIADLYNNNNWKEIATKISDFCRSKLNKEVEDITDLMNQSLININDIKEDWTDSLQKLMDARNKDPERFDNPRIAKFDNIVNDISNATGINISIDDEDVDERIGSFIRILIKLVKELDSERYEGALEYLR